ncbi:MAG: AAA family ATPase [Deltaproteobacteria bacterium]
MTTEELAKEAELFIDSIPQLKTLEGKALVDFSNLLAFDVGTICQICSHTEDNFGAEEEAASVFFYLAAAAHYSPGWTRDIAINHFRGWKTTDPTTKENLRKTLKTLFEQTKSYGLNKLFTIDQARAAKNDSLFDSLAAALYRAAQVVTKADGAVSAKEEEALRKIYKLIYNAAPPNTSASLPFSFSSASGGTSPSRRAETTDEVMADLNALIGLGEIKEQVASLANLLKVQNKRAERGMSKVPVSLHSVFYGPPGTGKTTVARLLGKIYSSLGLLARGHIVETDRAGMVAGYIGQTSLKVDEVVSSALDGVLFIDEAYALRKEHISNDFGEEAIEVLLKRMEDYRGRLVVIVAGYTDEMQGFIDSNPGLKSRFNRYFFFDHYKPEALLQIFEKFCRDGHFRLSSEARERLLGMFEALYAKRTKSFGNARLARNVFEKTIERQANRIVSVAFLTDEILSTIAEGDIPEPEGFGV